MSTSSVIVVTGLPGAGKTTLARQLAARYRLPLIAKDLIKEPLLDALGATDASQSRRLSDASFAVLFRVARELTAAGASFLLEGNFRPGEHEAPFREALRLVDGAGTTTATSALSAATGTVRVAQALCRVPEIERIARLQARERNTSRHAGHRFGERQSADVSRAAVADSSLRGDAFLDLPSARFVHDGAGGRTVHAALDDWMNLRAPSP